MLVLECMRHHTLGRLTLWADWHGFTTPPHIWQPHKYIAIVSWLAETNAELVANTRRTARPQPPAIILEHFDKPQITMHRQSASDLRILVGRYTDTPAFFMYIHQIHHKQPDTPDTPPDTLIRYYF